MMPLLVSCSVAGPHVPSEPQIDYSVTAKTVFLQVVNAIEGRDATALSGLFSELALSRADNFDSSMNTLFGFFRGSVRSQGMDGEAYEYEEDAGPSQVNEIFSFYHVDTENDKYSLFMAYRVLDTTHPDGLGIYSLRVIRTVDRGEFFVRDTDMRIPGIWCAPAV